eukprot:COSAG01_NODE_23_length_37704_cov_30.005877_33_plen_44_part_00
MRVGGRYFYDEKLALVTAVEEGGRKPYGVRHSDFPYVSLFESS